MLAAGSRGGQGQAGSGADNVEQNQTNLLMEDFNDGKVLACLGATCRIRWLSALRERPGPANVLGGESLWVALFPCAQNRWKAGQLSCCLSHASRVTRRTLVPSAEQSSRLSRSAGHGFAKISRIRAFYAQTASRGWMPSDVFH